MKPPISVFVVKEESMLPRYKPGDFILTFNYASFKKGSVVVFSHGKTLYIKRVTKISGNSYYLSGDNKTKSASFGPINEEKIIGRVFWDF